MIPWLLVAELICVKQQPLSALVNERISAYPSPGEINFRLTDAQSTIDAVRKHYEPLAISFDTTDGISFEFDQWRFNLRSSNTEPVVRLNLETRGDSALMALKLAEISQFLEA
jgi:phosphomannomutase